MIERKRVREIVGLTYDKLKSDPKVWFRLASSFNLAAKLLDEFQERVPSDSRPFVFNAALSLELVFKAILVKKKIKILQDKGGHNLNSLCKEAGLVISKNQKLTLELMTEQLIWSARYPTPRKPERFDEYHDTIFEKHVIRSQSGNVPGPLANPKTFSDFENYIVIWNTAVSEFEGLEP